MWLTLSEEQNTLKTKTEGNKTLRMQVKEKLQMPFDERHMPFAKHNTNREVVNANRGKIYSNDAEARNIANSDRRLACDQQSHEERENLNESRLQRYSENQQ